LTLTGILSDLAQRSEAEWQTAERKFIPMPATYLRKRRWEDEGVKLRPQYTAAERPQTRWDAICEAIEVRGVVDRLNRSNWLMQVSVVTDSPFELVVVVSAAQQAWIQKHYWKRRGMHCSNSIRTASSYSSAPRTSAPRRKAR
jgi:hypothetical protein